MNCRFSQKYGTDEARDRCRDSMLTQCIFVPLFFQRYCRLQSNVLSVGIRSKLHPTATWELSAALCLSSWEGSAQTGHFWVDCPTLPGQRSVLQVPPFYQNLSGISRDNWHKRRKTGGKRKPYHKKRKYELGRPAANTKIGPRRIHTVRVRGGNKKYRALRLDVGNFSWSSECCTRKTRIIDVVYDASNNKLVRTKTLAKNCTVLIDSAPYRQWYESHYALPLGRKKGAKLTPEEEEILNKKRSKKIKKK
nr:40S ribosomal protein S8-like [Rattus norvegicus]